VRHSTRLALSAVIALVWTTVANAQNERPDGSNGAQETPHTSTTQTGSEASPRVPSNNQSSATGESATQCDHKYVDASYPNRYEYNSLVDGTFKWGANGGSSVEINDPGIFFHTQGYEYVFAAVMDRSRSQPWAVKSLDDKTLDVEVMLTARENKDPVKVDKVRIYVEAFRPLPKFTFIKGQSLLGGPIGLFYYARLSPPENGKRTFFEGAYLPSSSDVGDAVEIEPGKMEVITVKVDATDPGYYMLGGEILLSRGSELQRFGLGNFIHVIYLQ